MAEGPNPAWNQQLKLNFVSPNNDYSADTLGRVKDEVRSICSGFFLNRHIDLKLQVHLHLFDEVAVDLLDDDEISGQVLNCKQPLHNIQIGIILLSFLFYVRTVHLTFTSVWSESGLDLCPSPSRLCTTTLA